MKQSIVLVLLAFYLAPSHGASTTIPNIVCGDGTGIKFELVIPDIAEWQGANASDWRLVASGADASCDPTISASNVSYAGTDGNGFNGDKCGVLTEDNDHLIYTFTISVAPSGGVTHRYDHSYTIKCMYDKEKQNIQASFLPQHSVSNTGQANGTLVFDFVLLNADDSDKAVISATTYDLRTNFKGKLTVTTSGFPNNALDVHFKSVKAGTTNDQNNNPTTLITDGCSAGGTAAASNPSCANNEEETFTFDTFRFAGQTTGNRVYIFVTAVVCLEASGTNSTCETECYNCANPGRKRRSTLEESLKTEYYLKYGPLKVADLEKEEKADTVVDEDEGSSVPAYFVAVGVVGGVVAVAIVCATVAVILVQRKRRYNATLAKSSGAHEVATPRV